MNLTNMKVGTRLGLGFALVLVLLVAVTMLGISRMSQINDRLDRVVTVNNVVTRLVLDMRSNVSIRVSSLKTLTLMTDPDSMEPEMKRFKEQTVLYEAMEKKLSDKFKEEGTAEEKAMLATVKEATSVAMPAIAKASELWLGNKAEDATRVFIKEIKPAQKKWMDALDKLAELEDKVNAAAGEEAEKAYNTARNFMLGLGVLAVALGIIAAGVITRGLLKQLGGEPDYTAEIAGNIAHGNLAIYIDADSSDTTSLLAEMRAMRDSLVGIVGQVRTGTETIGTASREIAAGNIDLSSRTEMQASSLEKTASAMEELTSTVKQNADNAREANQLAANASDVARKGGEVVSQVVDTMGSINDSAKKIVDIIGVIDGIAFQTNILASEVRNLAQRSAAAAKEIKTLIGDSVEKVERGSKLVGQAGVTMDEVVDSVKRVTDIMSEIANASQEQSAGIEQVNLSIIEMDSMTQQNAALVEEAAAAAQSLQDQASDLAHVVSIFKLVEGEEAHVYTPPAFETSERAANQVVAIKPKAAAKPALKRPAPAAAKPQKAAAAASDNDGWEEF